jgi:hypothetical protein
VTERGRERAQICSVKAGNGETDREKERERGRRREREGERGRRREMKKGGRERR